MQITGNVKIFNVIYRAYKDTEADMAADMVVTYRETKADKNSNSTLNNE